jgi:hypothetical protein
MEEVFKRFQTEGWVDPRGSLAIVVAKKKKLFPPGTEPANSSEIIT